nr:hypothetical protein [Candidatus Sigynarchaeota archaeon]
MLSLEFINVMPLLLEFSQLFFGVIFGGRVGYTGYIDRFTTTEKPEHLLLINMCMFLSFVAFYILKRKAIHVSVATKKHGRLSSWKNLYRYLCCMPRYASPKVHVLSIAFLIVVTGLLVTFQPPVHVRLPRNSENDIQVSFWDAGLDLPNQTLSILGSYNVCIYGWVNQNDIANARRYADHGVSLVKVIGMPDNEEELDGRIQFVNSTMNFWDANNLTGNPWLGFAFDKEEMDGIARYNSSKFQEAKDAVGALADFISSRGYGLYQTEYLLTINDLLDGDEEVAINNFDPIDFSWNLSHFDWMIYRAEIAIEYNEPSPFFTYEWARWIRYYAITMGGDALFQKTSMSIGVTSDELPLYRGYEGLAEITMDAQICQSVGIPEIIIFSLDGFFDEYGIDGFQEFMTALLGFDHVDIAYNRRATFFGNLKGNENPTGSVFGFFFQDKWLDAWV